MGRSIDGSFPVARRFDRGYASDRHLPDGETAEATCRVRGRAGARGAPYEGLPVALSKRHAKIRRDGYRRRAP
jgi:hypothetical protein